MILILERRLEFGVDDFLENGLEVDVDDEGHGKPLKMVPETDTIARRGHPSGLPPIGCETAFHVLLEKFRCGERLKASQAKVLSHMVFDLAEAKPVEIFGEGKAVFGCFCFRQLLSERKGGPACTRTVAACCRLDKWGRGHSTCPTQRL